MPIVFKKCQWGLDLDLKESLKWWVSGTKEKWPETGDLEGGTCPYYLSMWVPRAGPFYWGVVVPSISYFLFVGVGTNKLVGRLAMLAETCINQSLYTEVSGSMRFPLSCSSQLWTRRINVVFGRLWCCSVYPETNGREQTVNEIHLFLRTTGAFLALSKYVILSLSLFFHLYCSKVTELIQAVKVLITAPNYFRQPGEVFLASGVNRTINITVQNLPDRFTDVEVSFDNYTKRFNEYNI